MLNDKVVFGTLAGTCTAPVTHTKKFLLSIIDEAGQATEPAVLGILWRSDHVVFCGDSQQLPANGSTEIMTRSLMQRLSQRLGVEVQLLQRQYRMPPEMMRFPSQYFYLDKLTSHQPSLPPDQLVPGFAWPQRQPLAWVHVPGQENKCGTSWRNEQEVIAVRNIVTQLLSCSRNQAENIGVITPYAGQIQSLKKVLPTGIRIGTVDAFQGSEQDVIILSLVRRSNRGAYVFFFGRATIKRSFDPC